jgi:hypothetical protein
MDKFCRIINSNNLIINIDESFLNRGRKINYSWSHGEDTKIQNTPLSGSISVVLIMLSN